MRVAYITQPYDAVLPPKQNSIGLIVYNTARLVAESAEVTVFARASGETDADEHGKLRIAHVRSALDDALQDFSKRYPRWARRFGADARADRFDGWASVIAATMDRTPVDVVHVMNYWGWSRRLQGGKRRVVLEMQSEWLSQMDHRAVSEQLRSVDAVVAVSGHVERLVRESLPDYDGIVTTVHNGVDVEVFRPGTQPSIAADGPSLLFVGRVSPEKGVHTLIDAFARIAERFPTARLDIVGPRAELPARLLVDLSSDPLVSALKRFYRDDGGSDYQRELDGLVARHRLGGRVRFHGSLAHHDIVKHYQGAALVVNPSLSETFGISIVEGLACGVPVVGTRVGGMLDTITDDVGRAVPAEDPAALADAMAVILAAPKMAAQMGRQGRDRAVGQFTWRARADRMLAVYEQICARRTSRRTTA